MDDLISTQQWIPVAERLPETDGTYMVCDSQRRVGIDYYFVFCNEWDMGDHLLDYPYVAWMPLPEPYKDGEQDE